jgi:hypothetical protein
VPSSAKVFAVKVIVVHVEHFASQGALISQ